MNMLSSFFLCLLVGYAASSNYAWKSGTEYVYKVRGRTLASLHEVDDQYSGIVIRANVLLQQKDEKSLTGRLSEPQYAQVHAKLPGGWDSDIPEHHMNFKTIPMSNQPFELIMKNGTIQELIVDADTENWEANFIKSVVSQLQIDVQGENMIQSRYNQPAEHDSNSATFKTMEDTVSGKCETLYDIDALPEYVLQNEPELAPLPHLKGDGEIIDVVKTKNFSNCDERVGYHFGLHDMEDWEPASTNLGDFFRRSSVSRVILSGSLKKHTIQSSVTTNKIILRPAPRVNSKGLVVSQMNLTLSSVRPASAQPQELSQRQPLGNLVYRYNSPYAANNNARRGSPNSEEHKYDSDSSSSSISSSSDEGYRYESQNYRQKRSVYGQEKYYFDSSSSSSSSSLDSSEENTYLLQEKPTMTSPPETPLLPFTIGYKGQSVKNAQGINVVKLVQKLSTEIGHDLQTPSNIPNEDTLAKFTILAKLVRTMNVKEMQEASRELYNLQNKGLPTQTQAWQVYRDAMAEAGTGPALLTIKDWIENSKIEGEEAAAIVATVSEKVRTPTDEYLRTFYRLATDNKVQVQQWLNDSAILSFAHLIRKAYVDEEGSHNRYPVHVFGNFSSEHRDAVHKEYVPYLGHQLEKGIIEGNSHKILVYIRALGNIGHRQILSYFEPYLEGKKQVSQFQRLAMILAMDKLVEQNPKVARSVLYKIYQNKGEDSTVRVAAVHQLMRTTPPASMLQAMAENTNTDHSNEVNAAVKSAIESAANLQHCAYNELAENAKAAASLLTPEEYGIQYSKQFLRDYVVKEMDVAYKQNAGYLASVDSIIPRGYMFSLRANEGGAQRHYVNFQALVSSVEDLLDIWQKQTEKDKVRKEEGSKQQSQWSSSNIARLLNIKYDEDEQLEGQILFGMNGINRFYTFDNHTIEVVSRELKSIASDLKKRYEFNHTKVYDAREMTISFPTATGFPFVYTLNTPTLFSMHGEVQVISKPEIINKNHKIETPEEIQMRTTVRTVVSSKTQAKLGFVTLFDHEHYVAGYDKNVQLYLPVRANININIQKQQFKAEIEPLDEENELLHYSTWPYTAKQNIIEIKPISQSRSTEIVHQRDPQTWEKVIGQRNGLALRINYTSEYKYMDFNWLYEQFWRHEGLSYIMSPWIEDTVEPTEITLAYENDLSSTNSVKFQMGWNHTYFSEVGENKKPNFGQIYSKAKHLSDSNERQKHFLEKSVSGINNAHGYVCDISFEVNGKQSYQYNATIAVGRSNVDKQSCVLFYLNKDVPREDDYEMCLYVQNQIPNTNGLDFLYALKFDPTIKSDVKIAYGKDCLSGSQVDIQAKLTKTKDRKSYVQSHPMSQQCIKEMKEGNQQLFACRNMTARANLMDNLEVEITYENISLQTRNCTNKIYNALRYLGYTYLEENNYEGHGKPKHISLEVEFEPDFKYVNVSVETETMRHWYNNIRVHEWVQPFVAVHPVFNMYERVAGKAQQLLFRPTCVVDQNKIETLDNNTYPISLGKTWHVQMHYLVDNAAQSQRDEQQEEGYHNEDDYDYVVLVRDSGNQKKDVKITVNNEKNYYEIDMIPSDGSSHSGSKPAGQVFVNQKQASFDDKHSHDVGDDLVNIYALPNGDVKVEVNDDFYVIYDGERVKLTTINSDKFRDKVRGLCGTFDGEPSTDFLTPKNCILRHPREFASTYAIIDSTSQGPSKEYLARASQSPCYYTDVMYSNVISKQDYARQQSKQSHQSGDRSSSTCTKQQTQYVEENNGETVCFTIRPLPVCRSPCKAARRLTKNVDVHCLQKSNVTELWKKQIEKGASPDFSLKPVTKTITFNVPQSCSS